MNFSLIMIPKKILFQVCQNNEMFLRIACFQNMGYKRDYLVIINDNF